MKFKYTGRNKEGELQTGNVDAANREAALNILSGHDLVVLELSTLSTNGFFDRVGSYFNRVKNKDLVIFTRQFATLLESKIAIGSSLRTLQAQTINSRLKDIIFDLSSDVEAGLVLSQALGKFPNVFSEFYINLVRSAEVTGRMDEVMLFLADYLEKEYALKMRVRNALIYPVVVVALFVVVAALMVTLVIPAIKPIFEESHVALPIFTRILLGTSDFFVAWWWAILLLVIGLLIFALDYAKTPEGKAVYDELSLKIPIFGELLKKLYVARLAEAIAVLIQGGIPATQAVEIASHTVANAVYRDLLHEVGESVNSGKLISQAFGISEEYFPPMLIQMTSVGEATGRLEEMLKKVSKFYTQEVDSLVGNLVELIQPMMMVGIGTMVGLLFAAILLPLYNLAQAF
jgi:type IV pilus assembly protein PilC